MKKHCTAILLAGGRGSRMGAEIPKQFMEVGGKPLIAYALEAVERSAILDDCILVTATEDTERMRRTVLDRFPSEKVLAIAPAGSERCFSVANGIRALTEIQGSCDAGSGGTDVLFVLDGARPFLTEEILQRCYESVLQYGSGVAAVRSKDTVRIADENGFVTSTPVRSSVWNIQTPQAFFYLEIRDAYESMLKAYEGKEPKDITDDACVYERFVSKTVHLTEGSYENLKVTTPEDLALMEQILKKSNKA
jgi:2-C-methyl-D-erythritol 4-phosphate cytidylyltransferase